MSDVFRCWIFGALVEICVRLLFVFIDLFNTNQCGEMIESLFLPKKKKKFLDAREAANWRKSNHYNISCAFRARRLAIRQELFLLVLR